MHETVNIRLSKQPKSPTLHSPHHKRHTRAVEDVAYVIRLGNKWSEPTITLRSREEAAAFARKIDFRPTSFRIATGRWKLRVSRAFNKLPKRLEVRSMRFERSERRLHFQIIM